MLENDLGGLKPVELPVDANVVPKRPEELPVTALPDNERESLTPLEDEQKLESSRQLFVERLTHAFYSYIDRQRNINVDLVRTVLENMFQSELFLTATQQGNDFGQMDTKERGQIAYQLAQSAQVLEQNYNIEPNKTNFMIKDFETPARDLRKSLDFMSNLINGYQLFFGEAVGLPGIDTSTGQYRVGNPARFAQYLNVHMNEVNLILAAGKINDRQVEGLMPSRCFFKSGRSPSSFAQIEDILHQLGYQESDGIYPPKGVEESTYQEQFQPWKDYLESIDRTRRREQESTRQRNIRELEHILTDYRRQKDILEKGEAVRTQPQELSNQLSTIGGAVNEVNNKLNQLQRDINSRLKPWVTEANSAPTLTWLQERITDLSKQAQDIEAELAKARSDEEYANSMTSRAPNRELIIWVDGVQYTDAERAEERLLELQGERYLPEEITV